MRVDLAGVLIGVTACAGALLVYSAAAEQNRKLKADLDAVDVGRFRLSEAVEARLQVLEKGPKQPEIRKEWWCTHNGTGTCFRTLTDCQRMNSQCVTTEIAFCGGVLGANCSADLETCTTLTRDLNLSKDPELARSARMCVGVH